MTTGDGPKAAPSFGLNVLVDFAKMRQEEPVEFYAIILGVQPGDEDWRRALLAEVPVELREQVVKRAEEMGRMVAAVVGKEGA